MKPYKPNDLNRKCQIGMVKTTTTSTGGKVEKLDSETAITVWFGAKMRTLSLQFQVLGTEKADTFEIVIRHNPLVTKKLAVMIEKVLYDIINISSDESANFQRFDILTLKVKKKGA